MIEVPNSSELVIKFFSRELNRLEASQLSRLRQSWLLRCLQVVQSCPYAEREVDQMSTMLKLAAVVASTQHDRRHQPIDMSEQS